jgi:hypothetical protein
MDNDLYEGDNVSGLGSEDEMCMLFMTYYPYNNMVRSCGFGYEDRAELATKNCLVSENLLSRQPNLQDLGRAFDIPIDDCPNERNEGTRSVTPVIGAVCGVLGSLGFILLM